MSQSSKRVSPRPISCWANVDAAFLDNVGPKYAETMDSYAHALILWRQNMLRSRLCPEESVAASVRL